jgi:outer membrane protein OmpA-like peptidoglycan-associated protein
MVGMHFLIPLLLLNLSSTGKPGPSMLLPDNDGLLGVVSTHSSKSLKAGAIILGGSGRILHGISMLDGGLSTLNGTPKNLADCLVGASNTFLAIGLGYGFDASLGLPIYYEKIPGHIGSEEALDAGDATFTLKSVLPERIPFTALSLFAQVSAPTSSELGVLPKELAFVPAGGTFPNPTNQAMGLSVPRLGGGGGLTVDLSELADGTEALIHLNLTASRVLAKNTQNPLGTFRFSLASEISPINGLRLEAEFLHESLLASPSDLVAPLGQIAKLSLGLGLAIGRSLSLQGGVVIAPPAWNPVQSLTLKSWQGVQKLSYRIYPTGSIFFSLAWQGFPIHRDTDRDGVYDGVDNCPAIPEDQDGFQDKDGCPDPDNDGDGIPDELDNCPYAAEDFDGFEDRDGCPDIDNDHDNILEGADLCPNDPEDRDNFQDEDGCPDLDNDRDGIPDLQDKCPMISENHNGIEDQDGCPEQDQDGDGVTDKFDKCPSEKELINFYQDEDGCPDERPEPIRDGILTGVDFVTGTTDFIASTDSVLAKLAVRLQSYPGTEIEIQVHLDDLAGPGRQALTEARAEAIADALNKLGVELRRIKRTGYGSSRPLTSNRTAKGREMNRRVEIRRLN